MALEESGMQGSAFGSGSGLAMLKGSGGKGVWRWGNREIIYIYLLLHCHHQNDSCIKSNKTGSDDSL